MLSFSVQLQGRDNVMRPLSIVQDSGLDERG